MSRVESLLGIRRVFASNLDLVLKTRKIDNPDLVQALGRSDRGAVSKWRTGKHLPHFEELQRISYALELPPYALLIPRPDATMVLKALKVGQGDVSAARGMSVDTAREIVAEAAFWSTLGLGDPRITTLRTLPLDATIPGSEDAREQDRIQAARTELIEDLDEQA